MSTRRYAIEFTKINLDEQTNIHFDWVTKDTFKWVNKDSFQTNKWRVIYNEQKMTHWNIN